jgi:hypothetical protein
MMRTILEIAISIGVTLAVPIGIIYGIVLLVRRSRGSNQPSTTVREEPLPGNAARVFTYLLAFAGMMAVLFALAGLIGLACVPVIPGAGALISADDARVRASYDLAALVVGAPLWFFLWRLAQGRLERVARERDTTERRLYFGAVFAVTAIVTLLGAQELVRALMSFAATSNHGPLIRDCVAGGSQVLVYGVAWVAHARIGWRERPAERDDWTHDLAVYVVTGVSLVMLFSGVANVLQEIVRSVQGTVAVTILNDGTGGVWMIWLDAAASIIVGGAAWWALQIYDARRGRARIVRVVYLYAMLAWLIPLATFGTVDLVYECMRRAFGYTDFLATWNFFADAIPFIVAAGALASYHWATLRRQSTFQDISSDGSIPYARRPALAVFTAAGLGMVAAGVAQLLWLVVDWWLSTGESVTGGAWWRDGVSLDIGLILVGAALWVPAWTLLQRAAILQPERETASAERRWLIGGIVIIGALISAGFAVVLLYQLWRALLGAPDANILSSALHYGAVILIALAIAAYYGLILRAESGRRTAAPRAPQVRLSVLLASDADAALRQLTEGKHMKVDIIGQIERDDSSVQENLQTLAERLALLGTEGHADRALLVLQPSGGKLYAFAPWASSHGELPDGESGVLAGPPLPSIS